MASCRTKISGEIVLMVHAHLITDEDDLIVHDPTFTGACNICFQNIRDENANKIFRFSEYGDSTLRNKDGTQIKGRKHG